MLHLNIASWCKICIRIRALFHGTSGIIITKISLFVGFEVCSPNLFPLSASIFTRIAKFSIWKQERIIVKKLNELCVYELVEAYLRLYLENRRATKFRGWMVKNRISCFCLKWKLKLKITDDCLVKRALQYVHRLNCSATVIVFFS